MGLPCILGGVEKAVEEEKRKLQQEAKAAEDKAKGDSEEKPKEKKLKEVESKLADKLRRFYKWKNYFEVSSTNVVLVTNVPQKVTMSRKCQMELKRVDEATIELKFVGEGKHIRTVRQKVKPLTQGEYSIFGGDDKDKDSDAWFVVISQAGP